jgi:hypothetical protein
MRRQAMRVRPDPDPERGQDRTTTIPRKSVVKCGEKREKGETREKGAKGEMTHPTKIAFVKVGVEPPPRRRKNPPRGLQSPAAGDA